MRTTSMTMRWKNRCFPVSPLPLCMPDALHRCEIHGVMPNTSTTRAIPCKRFREDVQKSGGLPRPPFSKFQHLDARLWRKLCGAD